VLGTEFDKIVVHVANEGECEVGVGPDYLSWQSPYNLVRGSYLVVCVGDEEVKGYSIVSHPDTPSQTPLATLPPHYTPRCIVRAQPFSAPRSPPGIVRQRTAILSFVVEGLVLREYTG